jgi:hypothetical protein
MLVMFRRVIAWSPVAIGLVAILSLVPLLWWDVAPARFPSRSHDVFGAIPLFAIAAAHFAQQVIQKPSRLGWLRAVIVVAAFVAWAANQYWPEHALATLWNDIAIALFVIDIFPSVMKARTTELAGAVANERPGIEAGNEPSAATPSDAA